MQTLQYLGEWDFYCSFPSCSTASNTRAAVRAKPVEYTATWRRRLCLLIGPNLLHGREKTKHECRRKALVTIGMSGGVCVYPYRLGRQQKKFVSRLVWGAGSWRCLLVSPRHWERNVKRERREVGPTMAVSLFLPHPALMTGQLSEGWVGGWGGGRGRGRGGLEDVVKKCHCWQPSVERGGNINALHLKRHLHSCTCGWWESCHRCWPSLAPAASNWLCFSKVWRHC